MNLAIVPTSTSLSPNPVNTSTSIKLTFNAYEYVPGQYKIDVRRLTTRSGNPLTTRSGKYLLVPVKVPL